MNRQSEPYFETQRWVTEFDRPALRAFGRSLSIRTRREPAIGLSERKSHSCDRSTPGVRDAQLTERRWKEYHHAGIDVAGRRDRVPVTVVFEQCRVIEGVFPLYLPGPDFPTVYASSMEDSPHRFADGALCLYYPGDSRHRRWTHDNGLASLISLAADHLFFEDHFTRTGHWLADEAKHGLDQRRRA